MKTLKKAKIYTYTDTSISSMIIITTPIVYNYTPRVPNFNPHQKELEDVQALRHG
jgi:hypothetical protein